MLNQVQHDKKIMPDLHKPTLPSFGKNPVTFLKEARAELFKVNWPTKDEVIRLTLVVVAVSVAMGLYVGGLDFIFTKLTDILINR